ncbi:MAG: peptidoglycan DD-metalloendopeptidase family protein [Planctomycetaceae bacterium]|jgi:murein DD-endopeptidase MepM/ murein hydrolase activator NlpD|nr:peptidoglycan DD-metalloendopeptidase family protein [Planctomycetaceae bacterium]
MKHLFLSFLLLAVVPLGHTSAQQTEPESLKKVADQLQKDYNAGDNEAIFAAFAPAMQEALPMPETQQFFAAVKDGYKNIVERELVRYQNGTAIYKTQCEHGTFALTLTTDADNKISGLHILPYTEIDLPKMERTKSSLILPFHDEWSLVWGGDTPEQNYHAAAHRSQKNAMDFVIKNERGKSYRTSGTNNEDYYAFGKELFAPCDGEIVLVVDGVKDNTPGIMNPFFPTGNTVILKTDNLEYLVFAHFKQHSIKVSQGRRVKQGDVLGLCGNSGNSSEVHLHFHVQNVEDMNIAIGVKCYFAEILVDGEKRSDHSPVQNERVRNKDVP